MPILLRFRMLSDENDNFIRDYEVPYSSTLLEMHEFIAKDLHFDPDNVTSFFISDKEWDRLAEFTSVDMGDLDEEDDQAPMPMSDATLKFAVKNSGDRLIYEFDMLGQRAMYLELAGSQQVEEAKFKVTQSAGDPPDQFEQSNLQAGGGGSIFDEIMSDFNDFEGDDQYGDDDI